jgi:cytochrome c nitrite reductase small subunit
MSTSEPPLATSNNPESGTGVPSRRPGSRPWQVRRFLVVVFACALGAMFGIGGFTFRYAEGFSYFRTDPSACVNCHIMRPQYDAWQKSSHHAVAVCVDCHLPHDFVPKYLAKAENGYRHAKEFTAGTFAEPIFVKRRGREILEENCVRCHAPLVAEIRGASGHSKPEEFCVRCHAGVGHGEAARLGGRLRPEELSNGGKP